MIHVAKPIFPPLHTYMQKLQKMWETHTLTNNGPFAQELEKELARYTQVPHVLFMANGTLALQLALHAYGVHHGEVITTPYSYVATISAILWEHNIPVFVDIDTKTMGMDPKLIEKKITAKTKAILPVHAYGYPCDIDSIDAVAKKHHLPVIYDAAQAFGTYVRDRSIFTFGDISTASFHATKLFHTAEGGACFLHDPSLAEHLRLARQFGHQEDDHKELGINAKGSELHAALGLCLLPLVPEFIAERKKLSQLYNSLLPKDIQVIHPITPQVRYNYAYYPILLKDNSVLERVQQALQKQDIFPRRYFYPALNTLSYVSSFPDSSGENACPIAEDISNRVLSLPLYNGLDPAYIERICGIIKDCIT